MAGRAIWTGKLVIGSETLPVKMFSAVRDTTVHFRLLDAKSLTPVHQRIVRKTDGKEVPKDERRKAYPVDSERAILLTPQELERLEPPGSREIALCRFVAPSLLGEAWYDRPYYLGPDKDAKRYFALVDALREAQVLGIARWAMRKKRYVGALSVLDGYLAMVTLRRAEQVLAVPRLDVTPHVDSKELKLAAQLVDSIAGDFNPTLWQDEYHERVCRLIEAKARGKRVELHAPRRKRAAGGLAAQLRQSLVSVKERKVA
jgi:DNA end-binding protein Ku